MLHNYHIFKILMYNYMSSISTYLMLHITFSKYYCIIMHIATLLIYMYLCLNKLI